MTTTSVLRLLQGTAPDSVDTGASSVAIIPLVVMLAIALVVIIAMWKVYTKAGQPGWAILIPIYNLYILLKIAGRPGWWIILCCIPFVNLVIAILLAIDVAKSFGKSAAWGVVLLFLLCGLGYLVLGFGKATYVGPAALAKA